MTDLILETGKVMLRCGYEVRVHATNLSSDRPVLLSYLMPDKGWFALFSLQDGRQLSGEVDHQFDLVPIPKPQYFNIYRHPNGSGCTGYMCNSIPEAKEQAVKCAHNKTKLDDTYKYLDGEITKVEPEGDE